MIRMTRSRLRFGLLPLLATTLILAGCKNKKSPVEPEPEGPTPTLPGVDPSLTVTETNLDQENGGEPAHNVQLAQWNVIEGCVDLHGNGKTRTLIDVQPGNGLYLDLDGSYNEAGGCTRAGTIESKDAHTLQPGTYILEFFLAGNQQVDTPDTVVVSIGNLLPAEEIRVSRRQPFELYTREFSVAQTTSAKIRFAHAGADEQGALLDLVRLRRKP